MTAHEAVPTTTGVRFLREHGVAFIPRFYTFQEHGGTAHAAESLKVDEHNMVKTSLTFFPRFITLPIIRPHS